MKRDGAVADAPACSKVAFVAYDRELEDRIRELLAGEEDITEQRMFGGLGFLLRGNMAVAASNQGVMVRVNREDSARLIATTSTRPMEMRGRAMRGWLRVDQADVGIDRDLANWVERGMTYARSLPAKERWSG